MNFISKQNAKKLFNSSKHLHLEIEFPQTPSEVERNNKHIPKRL